MKKSPKEKEQDNFFANKNHADKRWNSLFNRLKSGEKIDTKISDQLNAAKLAKDGYDNAQKNCDELTSQIQGVIAKFDVIKNEISASSKKMDEYKQDVESK